MLLVKNISFTYSYHHESAPIQYISMSNRTLIFSLQIISISATNARKIDIEMQLNKKPSGQSSFKKSPYFVSVRRKSRVIQQNSLHHTKSNRSNSGSKNNLYNIMAKYGQQSKKKSKQVFKRFNQFQDVYHKAEASTLLQIDTRKKAKEKDQKQEANSRNIMTLSNPRQQSKSKYRSQKSIPLLAPQKLPKQKNQKFRTKISSGNSLVIKPQVYSNEREDNWLCRELIYKEVYVHDDDYGF